MPGVYKHEILKDSKNQATFVAAYLGQISIPPIKSRDGGAKGSSVRLEEEGMRFTRLDLDREKRTAQGTRKNGRIRS